MEAWVGLLVAVGVGASSAAVTAGVKRFCRKQLREGAAKKEEK